LHALDTRPTDDIYRIEVRFLGADPRIELRESELDDAALSALAANGWRAWMRTGHGPPPHCDSSPTIQSAGRRSQRRWSGRDRGLVQNRCAQVEEPSA
jgi:hypothetical protein